MAKHIGIIACSSEGAALCYRTICLEAAEILGEDNLPEVTMHTPPFREYMQALKERDWGKVADVMVSSIEVLKHAGAKVLITPDNTIHQAYDIAHKKARVGKSGLIWLHIAGVVAEEAKRCGYKRLGVLGTNFLMEGPVYRDILPDYNIDHVIPDDIKYLTPYTLTHRLIVRPEAALRGRTAGVILENILEDTPLDIGLDG